MSQFRRFGQYPANNQQGIYTAIAAYEDGFKSGQLWDSIKNPYVPGGPWICRSAFMHKTDSDWMAFCDATIENNREWLRGWHEGKASQKSST